MMHISFYFDLLKDTLVRKKYGRHSRTSSMDSAILMFHHVAETCSKGVSSSCYSSIEDFRNLLATLEKTKRFVSLSNLCSDLNNGIVPKDKIVITFDDVLENVYFNAIPILREFNAPYTLYITTSFIGREGYLSKAQLLELSKDPLCTVGSHTVSHGFLKNKDVNLEKELFDSKKELEQIINKPVEHFAYPFGTPFAITKKVIKKVASSGVYQSAVCTIPAYINKYSIGNMFSLPRIHSKLFIDKFLKVK